MSGDKTVLATLGPGAGQEWAEYVEWFPPPSSRPGLLSWVLRFARAAKGLDAVVLRGTSGFSEGYRDLLAAGLISRFARGPRVVVSDATIEPGSRALARVLPGVGAMLSRGLSRLLVRWADGPGVRWCVLSRDELLSFSRTWGVDPDKVVFTPFSTTTWTRPAASVPETDAPYVFSGGNSLRDYQLLLDAVEPLGVRTVVASSWEPPRPPESLEIGPVAHEDFMSLMANAAVVVVPLEVTTRSTGQQTYLNAMWFERPVIVTEAPGVHDYIDDGETGVVVPPQVQALRTALEDVLDDSRRDHYAEMGARARAVVEEHYRDEHYRRRLLEVCGVVEPRPERPTPPPAPRREQGVAS